MSDTWKKFGAGEKQSRGVLPSDQKRRKVSVYLNKRERERIEGRAETVGLSRAVYIRRAALEGEMQSKSDREARQDLKDLAVRIRSLRREVDAPLDDIEETLDAIREAAKRL